MKKVVTLILSILLIGTCFVIGTSATVYRTDVDQDYGFYKIVSMDKNQTVSYDNKTLTINVSDSVVWINDATPDEPLTIISKQGLWNNTSARLRWNYQKFNYTFNEPGTYSFYIREYPRKQHQKIIVNVMGASSPSSSPSPSPMMTFVVKRTPTVTQVISETSTVISTEDQMKVSTKFSGGNIIIFNTVVVVIVILLALYFRKKA